MGAPAAKQVGTVIGSVNYTSIQNLRGLSLALQILVLIATNGEDRAGFDLQLGDFCRQQGALVKKHSLEKPISHPQSV